MNTKANLHSLTAEGLGVLAVGHEHVVVGVGVVFVRQRILRWTNGLLTAEFGLSIMKSNY